MATVTKTELRQALQHYGGVIAKVAEAYQVTRQTVYNWIDKYHLREMVESSRKDERVAGCVHGAVR